MTRQAIGAASKRISSLLLAFALALGAGCPALLAAGKAAPAGVAESAEPPPQVQALLNLLADPAVRAWLEKQKQAAPPADQAKESSEQSPSAFLAGRMRAVREHLAALVDAAPRLRDELAEAGNILFLEFEERGLVQMGLLLAGFVALGFGVQGLFLWLTRGALQRIIALPLDSIAERLRAVLIRLAYGLGMVISFAAGSIGAFLAFTWPPLVRDILLGYLFAFLALRLVMVVSRFFLAPGGERFRIVPMSTGAAWFWHRRVTFLVGWFAFCYVTLDMLLILGVTPPAARLLAYGAGLVLLAAAVEMVWRHPGRVAGRNAGAWLVTAYFVLLWALRVTSSTHLFWLLVVAVGLPAAIGLTRRSVNHLLRPPGAAKEEAGAPSVTAACLERGLRAAWIIAAALLLVHTWDIHLGDLAAQDTALTRLVRGVLMAIVILLVADFGWNVIRALIDRKLVEVHDLGQPDTDDAHRRARLRTLLPILRNVLMVVLVVMAALMALSSMGVEIGPLIAGAGVVGVAVGFGAQTLVRDIFSGIFFLTDDAFRIGEYIQSGNYKGTVESFSLRSVKLRHHRGPLYTVPFGTLGAVQNMSRDWVIDKLTVGVTYDSDLDKAKKLIKQIGKELQADPEFGKFIIEPLKMQGVEQFGDFAIQIRMKMMTKPGEQFVIRRRALALIKKAFEANGIKFASPTVQIAAGADPVAAAAAHQALAAQRPPAES
ncbi:MAG: mechanosensitive ion channel [Alphaproteobacteria bacterium]|nr:mechanosensitive ion channel [Alphaproteobacteria bacterium]